MRLIRAEPSGRRWLLAWALPLCGVEPAIHACLWDWQAPAWVRLSQGGLHALINVAVLAACLGLWHALARLYAVAPLRATRCRQLSLLICGLLWLGQGVQRLSSARAPALLMLGRGVGAALAASGILVAFWALGQLQVRGRQRDGLILSFAAGFSLVAVACQGGLARFFAAQLSLG